MIQKDPEGVGNSDGLLLLTGKRLIHLSTQNLGRFEQRLTPLVPLSTVRLLLRRRFIGSHAKLTSDVAGWLLGIQLA